MINLEWLRTFGTIYECRNITEASLKLNMTQPGVSKHLLALENHIGKKLFNRTTRKLFPTEYGNFLYTQVNTPLKELKKVEYYAGKRSKKERLAISIGCTYDFYKKELVSKIYEFDMYIATVFGNEKELAEALEMDKIQLAVGVKKYSTYDHQFDYCKKEELILVCSKNMDVPVERESKKLVQWLQKQTWFVFDNDQYDIRNYWKANFNASPKIVPKYVLPSYIDMIEVMVHTKGVSIVPKHLCENELENGDIIQPFESLMEMPMERFYAYKERNTNIEAINVFKSKLTGDI